MNKLRALLCFGLGLVICGSHSLLAQTSEAAQPNADIVRAAYAKLVFATQLSALREAYTSGANSGRLKVTLSPITTGPVSDIGSKLLSDLVAKPSGRTLSVSPVNWTYTSSGGKVLQAEAASAVWTDSGYLAEDWDIPIGKLLTDGTLDPGYTQYASFTVNLSYLGERRQYSALFLFGSSSSGKSLILPIDHIIGISALQSIIASRSTPDPLLADRFRDQPATKAFLKSLLAPNNCMEETHTQMCCDHATGTCGVSSNTLERQGFSVSKSMSYIEGEVASPECQFACSTFNRTNALVSRSSPNDTTDHYSGYHYGSVNFQSSCTYGGDRLPCVGYCHVAVTNGATSETGTTVQYCHERAMNQNGNDGEGSNSCSGSWGFAVQGCSLCLCNLSVTVTVPPVSVSPSGNGKTLYTWGQSLTSGPCSTIN